VAEIELEERRTADAPRDRCWELLTDPDRAHEWLTLVRTVRAEGGRGEGRILHGTGELLGVRMSTTQTVHLWREPEAYGWQGDDPFPMRVEIALDEESATRTVVTVRAQADPGRALGLGGPILRRAVRSTFARSADRFRRLVETGGG